MANIIKREVLEWVVLLTLLGGLYVTGLHKEVIGFLQRGVLATGFITPDIDDDSKLEASYDLVLTDANNNVIELSDYRGTTLFINLWATWCPPCIAEMPDIQELYNEVGEDVSFVMISLDENPKKALDFVNRKDLDLPIYFLHSDLPDVYASQSSPTTYVISPEGKIVVLNRGMAKYNTEEFRSFLVNL
jgi:thiol-disulfide isomerase/thioredoxin